MTEGQTTDVVPTHTHPDRWPDTQPVPGCDGCASDDPFPLRSDAIYNQEADPMTDIDPIEPTKIAPGLAAMPLAPTVWDDLPDGQVAVTSNSGVVWQRRDGLWYMHPWWQESDADEIIAICAKPDDWAHDMGWPRHAVEEAYSPLVPITLPPEGQS